MIRIRTRRPLTSILVPTDFSAGAKLAVVRAARLPLAARATIHLVHVLPAAAKSSLHVREHLCLQRAADLIGRTAAAAGLKPPALAEVVLNGEAYVEIIRYARQIDADLIVLGAKGAGTNIRKVLGTTAARVVRMGDTPVLVVKTRANHPYLRPLVALPLDPSARRLVELTARIAGRQSAALSVVRAYHLPFAGFIDGGTAAHPSLAYRQCKAEAESALAVQVDSLRRNGLKVKPILRDGDARSVIANEAVRQRADLVALGTHARSGIAHALLGSVAEWAAVNVARDVLIARPVRFTFEAP